MHDLATIKAMNARKRTPNGYEKALLMRIKDLEKELKEAKAANLILHAFVRAQRGEK